MKSLIFLSVCVVLYAKLGFSCVLVSNDETDLPKLISEKALIIWDSEQRIESFIRIPQIYSNKDEVGFIVPVPNMPDVSDISKNIFDELDEVIENKRPVKYILGNIETLKNNEVPKTIGSMSLDDLDDTVSIIKKFHLAQYDVLVIKSTNLDQLSNWMELNGFKMRDAVKKWIQLYVEKNFYFTVFKFKANSKLDKKNLTTNPIQIRFKSEQPYYPYQEPEDSPVNSNRNLSLYFLSDAYYSPAQISVNMIGYGKPIFASPIDSSDVPSFKINLSKLYLLKWNDLTIKRPTFDLVFYRDSKIIKPILLPAKIVSLVDLVQKYGTTVLYTLLFFVLIYVFVRNEKIYEQLFRYRSLIGLSLLILSVVWSFLFGKVRGSMNVTLLFLINCNYVLIISYGLASLFRKNYKAALFDILIFPLTAGIIAFIIFLKL